jgi:hypothetical protein
MAEKAGVVVLEWEDLYVLPLDQFTQARDDLARRLKSDGEDDEAKRVAKLRKPSVAALALNRVAREDPKAVARLLESHRMLREADTREALEEASRQRREMVSTLTDAAVAELDTGSQQTRDRINRTLLAVATDTGGEADLQAGTLVRELEPTGVGWGEIELPPPPPPDPVEEANRLVEEARKTADQLETKAEAAEQDLERAKDALAAARDRAKKARAAATKAAKELSKAEEAARKA